MDELRRANERNYADARDRALTLGSSVGSRQFGDSLQALQAQISAALSGGQFGLANDQARAGETLNLGQFLLGNQQAQSNEALARAQFGLAGDQARSAEALNLAQFGAGQTQAAFGRQQSAAEFNAAQRQRALLEALQLRQLPLSELNALRTGAQPTVLGGELKQTSVPRLSAVDLLGADAQRYGQELDLYNSKVGSQNALLQVLGQIAGVAIGRP
jgi:hypothetical protein